jgi:prepilin-type N-terminal cleavage/methylation domain-containing protein
MKKALNKIKGFTLLELLVVVLILGILAAIALPMYRKSVERSRAVEALSVMRSMQNALRIYNITHTESAQSIDDFDINFPGTYVSATSRNTEYFRYRISPGYNTVLAYRLPPYTKYSFNVGDNGMDCCWETEQYKSICYDVGFTRKTGSTPNNCLSY